MNGMLSPTPLPAGMQKIRYGVKKHRKPKDESLIGMSRPLRTKETKRRKVI